MDYSMFTTLSADSYAYDQTHTKNVYPQITLQVASHVYYLESRERVDFAGLKDDGQRCREQEHAAAVSRLERALRGLEV